MDQDGAPPALPRAKDPLSGQVLEGRWTLERQIGVGGMGVIYKAKDAQGDAPVAIKILLGGDHEEEHTARFRQETQVMAQLQHPNVVRLMGSGVTPDGKLFMAMEYLHGKTLEALVPQGGVPVESAVAVMEEICAGVGAAHARRLVHRDLKPENIFVARQEDGTAVVKVIDFGLAKTMEDQEDGSLTAAGKVVGSAGYVAPEHIMGGRVFTDASDIYALGAIFFFMLSGQRPHEGENIMSIMEAQVREKPPELPLPEDHPGKAFSKVVRRAMSRAPERRFATAREFLAAIHDAYRKGQRSSSSSATQTTLSLSGVTIKRASPPAPPPDRRRLAFGLGAAVGLVLVVLVAVVVGPKAAPVALPAASTTR